MSRYAIGLACCLAFVTLEAFQAVYLGAVFQHVDSFLFGSCVFGLSVAACTVAAAIRRPTELAVAARHWRIVVTLNVHAAATWLTYFLAVQLIEPAIVFTVFSGMVPLGTVVAGRVGMPEARASREPLSSVGNALILLSILVLGAITAAGASGFVRGGPSDALLGVGLAAVSGGLTAFVILHSVRLHHHGVGPLTQFGLRFVLYTVVALIAFHAGWDAKTTVTTPIDLAGIVAIGLVVIALPLYLVQKAVPLVPPSLIAAVTALGPVLVFLMQQFDARVQHSNATLAGLAIYVLGAMVAIRGEWRRRRHLDHA